jgi:hypothetical protein
MEPSPWVVGTDGADRMPVPASGNDVLFIRLNMDEITPFAEDSQ